MLRGILTTYDLLSYDARNSFSGGGECDDRPYAGVAAAAGPDQMEAAPREGYDGGDASLAFFYMNARKTDFDRVGKEGVSLRQNEVHYQLRYHERRNCP